MKVKHYGNLRARRQHLRKLPRTLLSLILIFPLLGTVLPSERDRNPTELFGEENIIKIQTEADFLKFSKNCQLDSFSKGKRVVLENDLDFRSSKFTPIPIFYGEFDGNHHQIKGVQIHSAGSKLGLFRINCGTVKNLEVHAEIFPRESASSIGIIAGENRSQILHCKSMGKVKGKNEVGGISGKNCFYGRIADSQNEAEIIGTRNVGGIAGSNEGWINGALNSGEVNTSKNQGNNSSIDNLSQIKINLRNELNDEKIANPEVFSSVGGISGSNAGNIANSSNLSDIGYPHLGYNVGGISGLSSGLIRDCKNVGAIRGRKDIGGIAGQLEPHIDLKINENLLEELRERSEELSDLFVAWNDDVLHSSQSKLDASREINTAIKHIKNTLKKDGGRARSFSEEKAEILHKALTSINETNQILLQDYLKYSELILKDAGRIHSDIGTMLSEIHDLIKLTNESSTATQETVKSARKELIVQRDRLLKLEEKIKKITDLMTQESETIHKNIELLNEKIRELQQNMGSLSILDLGRILREIPVLLSELSQSFHTIFETSKKAIEEINAELFDAGKIILAQIERINDSVGSGISKLSKAHRAFLVNMEESIENLDEDGKRLNKDLGILNKLVNEALRKDNEQIRVIEDTLKDEFDYINDTLHSGYESLYKDSIVINETLAKTISESQTDAIDFHQNADQIAGKVDQMTKLLIDMAKIPEYKKESVYEFDKSQLPEGCIAHSRNEGSIRGDSDVGGICGMISIEPTFHPEEEFQRNREKWRDTTCLMRAILYENSNLGGIESKTDYAGGIVGEASTGLIYKNSNKGKIKGKNFLGGIAGYCDGRILACNSLCDIEGSNHIGGIGGFAGSLLENRSMVQIKSDGEHLGAIAGEVKEDSELIENTFVKEDIGGIDNISYANKAYPLRYEDFIRQSQLPDYFNTIHIRFYEDEKLVKSLDVPYGGSLSASEIPTESFDERGFGQWEDFEKKNIRRSQEVHLKRNPWIKTISNKGQIPNVLAEGKFFPDAKIIIEESNVDFDATDYTDAKAFQYEIKGGYQDTYLLRVRLNKGQMIKREHDATWETVDYKTDGSYAVFSATKCGKILILTPNKAKFWALLGIGGSLLSVVLLFLHFRVKKGIKSTLKKLGIS